MTLKIDQVLTNLAEEYPEETIKREIKREVLSSSVCLCAPEENSHLVKVMDTLIQGAVEPAWFSRTNPDMGIVCYGPKIENAHTINETLHIHTLTPVLQSLGYALQHAGELR